MKATDLCVFPTESAHSNWAFVKLYTDDGLAGVGEASLECFDDVVVKAPESFKNEEFILKRPPVPQPPLAT
jgi:galactonate dehydratase